SLRLEGSQLPLRHPCCPIYPRHPLPAQEGEGAEGAMHNHGGGPPGRVLTSTLSERRMFADQFQRNGVILDQRFGIPNGDTAAVSRGGAAGFTVAFEIAVETRRGMVG